MLLLAISDLHKREKVNKIADFRKPFMCEWTCPTCGVVGPVIAEEIALKLEEIE